VVAVGADPHSLCRAVNAVIEAKGGIAVADESGVELLPLPIAGLMSDGDGQEVGRRYADLDRLAHGLGSGLRAPFHDPLLHGLAGDPGAETERPGVV
jgi:adenine deaminase